MKHDAGHQETRKISSTGMPSPSHAITTVYQPYSLLTVKRSVTLISYSLTTKLQIHIGHYYFNGRVI